MEEQKKQILHTIVLSDIHLTEAVPPHPKNPLWKRYRRERYFIDRSFARFLNTITEQITDPIELIFNGDTFDFDSVLNLPVYTKHEISLLEQKRGLHPEEEKSAYKMQVILDDHSVWIKSVRDFILKGNSVVFVIGNHDIELHWPQVQEVLRNAFDLSEDFQSRIRFCEWYYISNQDTLIEHGNQYDSYCVCPDPVSPFIERNSKHYVRLPFGNHANRFMLNGMGFFNPYIETNFIMTLKEYIHFFFKYVIGTQPFLIFTWFAGALATLYYSLVEASIPAVKNPIGLRQRMQNIAAKSNSNPETAHALLATHSYSAIYNPFKIMRELWLDRAFIFAFILFLCFNLFSILKIMTGVSVWLFVILFLAALPLLIFYSHSIQSDIESLQREAIRQAPIVAELTNISRIIHGHTHKEKHIFSKNVELINTGTWSPAFRDLSCIKPLGRKCFAWIRPSLHDPTLRESKLCEWNDPGIESLDS